MMATGAAQKQTCTLSEHDSKVLLARYGLPIAPERVVVTAEDASSAAEELGFPVVAKLCGDSIAHKTERGLVRLGLTNGSDVREAASELLGTATSDDGDVSILVAPMLRGSRELIAGLSRDAQFEMTIMLGVGGVLAEALADVTIRLAPITTIDAEDMLDDLATRAMFGPFRGEPPIDRSAVCDLLVGMSNAAEAEPRIVSVDLNPLIVVDGRPVAVDALIELEEPRT